MQASRIVAAALIVLGLSGCVTKENYNAQVLRANNFQRLLSEEEKRSVELSAEIARLKDQAVSLEAKHKGLTAQLNDAKAQVVRSLEEVGRLQEEVKQARAFGGSPALRGPSQEPPDRLGELQEAPAPPPDKRAGKTKGKAKAEVKAEKPAKVAPPPPQAAPPPAPPVQAKVPAKPQAKAEPAKPPAKAEEAQDESFFRYHVVKKGETLASIAKRYKTYTQTLQELNDMASGDQVKPGDRLIVGQKQ